MLYIQDSYSLPYTLGGDSEKPSLLSDNLSLKISRWNV